MAPDSAFQLYTVHGFVNNTEVMPLLWALVPNKTQSTYVELFTALRERLIATYGDTGCQHTFIVDFETAAINAMSSVFPDATVKGCSFHFRQAIVRRVQKEGLMAQYEDADYLAVVRLNGGSRSTSDSMRKSGTPRSSIRWI